ncbi:NUDIX domain-containing protein [Dyadobacter tibetensis]|uniref:NUDIX domain-containing protein n=1 Tax=Dyadobacter tibetensis TaxID=1211851 RepID=UPI000470C973|nr:NUDIX domain-containing protein [Dyadobacter tibetensis]
MPVPSQGTQVILPAIAVAIFNEKGEILLQHRRDVGQWGVISGHVEFGESVEEAVLREIYEETGVDQAKILSLIGVYSAPESQTYHYGERTVQYITTYFLARLEHSLPERFSSEETLALKFFAIDALPHNLAQMHESWLIDALHNYMLLHNR